MKEMNNNEFESTNMYKVCEMLGVGMNEPFYVYYKEPGIKSNCTMYIDETGLIDNCDGRPLYNTLGSLIAGKCTIIRENWKPKEGEEYYSILPKGDYIGRYTFESDCLFDVLLVNMGNCFKTLEEAVFNKEDMIFKIKGVLVENGYKAK